MAIVKYSVHETPNPTKDGKKRFHVRPVSDRAVKMDRLASDINEMSSFSTSDVKGMLEAFSAILKRYLAEGATVELDGIGLFNISIVCPKNINDPSKINASNIAFKKVNFKSNIALNNELRNLTFAHAADDIQKHTYSEEERLKRILDFLKSEGNIQSSVCMGLNDCSRYIALKDLNMLVESGKITQLGNRASSIYLIKEE